MKISERALARSARIKAFQASVQIREGDPTSQAIIEKMKALHQSSPEARRLAKLANKRAKFLALCSQMNGPDIFIDRYLRSFLMEYNGRLFSGNGSQQPNSFNVVGSFIEPDPQSLVLKLLPEKHFSVRLDTLLDHITDPSKNHQTKDLVNGLDELIIHEYHLIGGYSSIFLGGLDLTFHGAAFVREGDEISIIGLFGRKLEVLEKGKLVERPKPFPGKEFLYSESPIDISDIEIIENSNRTPLITLSRISLSENKSQVRYTLLETKDTYDVITNDPQVHADLRSIADSELIVKYNLERLNEFLPLIEFVEQIPYFQLSIDRLDDFIKVIRHPTNLRLKATSATVKNINKHLVASECPKYVDIHTIDAPSDGVREEFFIKPQNLKIEERGYWKTLPNFMAGRDRNGDEVQGKSWVESKESWYEITNVDYRSDQKINVKVQSTSSPGTVYVLRNAQHPKNTYKIGYTTKSANERAGQLSSTSGQPDAFGVMHEWDVADPRAVEQEVHQRLAAYRVNKKREFFQLEYKFIHQCIEDVINAIRAEDYKPSSY